MAEEKINKKYDIRTILKEFIENKLKKTEVIMKDEIDDLKYENLQSIAEVLNRKTTAIKTLGEEIVELETNTEKKYESKSLTRVRVLKYTTKRS